MNCPVDIASQIACALASIVAPTFGLSQSDIIIVTKANDILITSCGFNIIKHIVVSHPLGAFILENLRVVNDKSGDGCTMYTLMLASVLKNSRAHCYSHRRRRARLTRFAVAVLDLKRVWYPLVLRPLMDSWKISLGHASFLIPALTYLSKACFDCSFSPKTSDLLVGIVIQWIQTTAMDTAKMEPETTSREVTPLPTGVLSLDAIASSLKQIDDVFPVLMADKALLSDTKIVEGSMILPKPWLMSHSRSHALSTPEDELAQFVVVRCSLDLEIMFGSSGKGNGANVTGVVNSTEQVGVWTQFSAKRATRLVKILKSRGVNVFICTEKVDDDWADALSQHGILGLQYLDENEALYLSRRSSIFPIYSCSVESFASADIGRAKNARQVVYGGRPHVLIDDLLEPATRAQTVYRDHEYPLSCPQILLRAPTEGLAIQYRDALQRVIRMLHAACTEPNGLNVMVGQGLCEHRLRCWCSLISVWLRKGGAAAHTFPELWMAPQHHVDLYFVGIERSQSSVVELSFAMEVLGDSFGQIVNSLRSKKKPSEDDGRIEFCFDHVDLNVLGDGNVPVFDSLQVKSTILVQLLTSWHQLLRLSGVTGVQGRLKPSKNEDSDEEDG